MHINETTAKRCIFYIYRQMDKPIKKEGKIKLEQILKIIEGTLYPMQEDVVNEPSQGKKARPLSRKDELPWFPWFCIFAINIDD